MEGIQADKIVGYVMDGYLLCEVCIDQKDEADTSPVFIGDELPEGSHCDNCKEVI